MDRLRLGLHPTLRHYVALVSAFSVQTLLRSFCINSPYVFGKDLQANLAPIERNDIAYKYILATRLIDLTLAIYIWRRETGGHKRRTDAPLLGILLSLISRVPLYLLLSHHFLLSSKTLFQILLTDIFASSSALWVISKIEPKAPSFYPSPTSGNSDESPLAFLRKDRSRLEMVGYALGLSTLLNAIYSYVAERVFMQSLIRNNVMELQIPSYLSALKPSFAEAMAHPTIAIPVLRSSSEAMSMPSHILHAAPLSILLTILSLIYLPQKSPKGLAGLVFLLTAPSNALSVFNLLPLKANASMAIGLDHGLKAAVVAYIVAWATEDWRRPYANRNRNVLKAVEGQEVPTETVIIEKDSITFRENLPGLPEGETLVEETQEVELLE